MAERPSNEPVQGDEPRRRPDLVDRLRALHASKQQYLDDALAPEVDLELLRRLVRKELAVEDAQLLYELIHAFRAWDDAHTQLLVAEARLRRR